MTFTDRLKEIQKLEKRKRQFKPIFFLTGAAVLLGVVTGDPGLMTSGFTGVVAAGLWQLVLNGKIDKLQRQQDEYLEIK